MLPTDTDLSTIANFFARLQEEDSPFEKLQYLLKAISTIFHSVSAREGEKFIGFASRN